MLFKENDYVGIKIHQYSSALPQSCISTYQYFDINIGTYSFVQKDHRKLYLKTSYPLNSFLNCPENETFWFSV